MSPVFISRGLLAATALFLFVLPIPRTTSIRLIALFIAFVFAWLGRSFSQMPKLPLKIPFAIWALVALASVPAAMDPIYSLNEIKAEIGYGFLTFLLFFTLASERAKLQVWSQALLASLAATTAGGIYAWLTGKGAVEALYLYNGMGAYSTLVITLLPFLFWAAFAGLLHSPRHLLWLLVPAAFAMAFIASNRMFWLATIAILVWACLFVVLKESNRTRRNRILSIAGLALAIAGSLFFAALYYKIHVVGLDSPGSALWAKTAQFEHRPRLWLFSLDQILQNPWHGYGFGLRSFGVVHPEFQAIDRNLWHAHNIFLDYGLQMGIPGISAALLLFAAIVVEYWKFAVAEDKRLRYLGLCGTAIVAAVIMKSMTDHFFMRDLALLFWALVGITLGYGRRLSNEIQEGTTSRV